MKKVIILTTVFVLIAALELSRNVQSENTQNLG